MCDLAKEYYMGALLRNARTCLCAGLGASYFGVIPPTLGEYFGVDLGGAADGAV
jgi:hypothetical protein